MARRHGLRCGSGQLRHAVREEGWEGPTGRMVIGLKGRVWVTQEAPQRLGGRVRTLSYRCFW